MSNVVRNGFSTLNRLLGKKNKNGSNGGLSKSSTNLNRSTTNLDATSQHNKITPLAASTNAPFEQTFRITVWLPLDQLYVARVGAKTKLLDVLSMVCTNKLLDPSKFEFRHPIDDTQVFELDLTIGEVGLNEIRLAPKSCHAAAATEDIKFRTHSNHSVLQSTHVQSDYRFTVINHNQQRPHTMSASPYSSTNSLNSTDSSGPNFSLRSNVMPSVPCRKKRVAPRPPSQNSIPEDTEQNGEKMNAAGVDDGVFKRPQLIRQNFHVSSPNLMQTHLTRRNKQEASDSDISLTGREHTTKIIATADDSSLSRPLSMPSHEDEIVNGKGNAYGSRTHSRTSSDTSDRDGNWPEPVPRKRIFIGKKKTAPSPPPRISSVNHMPVATPRNILQKLTEEQSKEIDVIVESKCEEIVPQTRPVVTPIAESTSTDQMKKESVAKLNVSKVMLNVDVDETAVNHDSNANELIEHIFSHKIVQMSTNGGRNVSRTQINGTTNEPISSTPKKRSISVVKLNVDHSDATDIEQRLTEIEHADLSKEVNEIIDKAIEMNEARLTAAINGDDWLPDKVDEVNNNHAVDAKSESPLWIYTLPAPPTFADGTAAAAMKLDEKCTESDSGVCAASPKGSLSSSDDEIKSEIAVIAERPIEPIICEKSPIDFHHETSDNSLPTSSTYGTMSTEPESLRTSDIEDGYKGNNNSTIHAAHVNGEQFVENEFEFLANERYDEDAVATPSPITTNGMAKSDVIEELTTIISANRLYTVIKPNDEIDANEATAATKRITLSNFQIGAYNGNGNHENVCPKAVAPTVVEKSPAGQRYKRHSLVENAFEGNENGPRRSSTPKRVSLTNGLGVGVSAGGTEKVDANAMKAPKYVSRSKSFHSTLSWSAVRNANAENRFEPLAQTSTRSTSFVSLNGTQRGLTDATRQRSSSELSIADSPSLQSVEVLKSIMNSSRKNSVGEQSSATIKMSATEKTAEAKADHAATEKIPLHASANGNGKTKIEPKTWKYEGPPSINLSTWGERPKSQVFIKSDSDYKFGGMSKMMALQKRFSAAIANPEQSQRNVASDSDTYKLPVVRGVEFKRTLPIDRNGNNGDASSVDTIDSEVDLRPARRPSYEISRIVSDKPINYTTMTLGRRTSATKHENSSAKKQFGQNRNTIGNALVQRVVSFNGNAMHAPVVKGFKSADISNNTQHQNESRQPQQSLVKLSTYEAAPPFSQFTLRRTGLKEKILDASNNNVANVSNANGNQLKSNHAVQNTAAEQKNKRNTIPTAPKPPPPPISEKPIGVVGRSNGAKSMHRSQSMPIDPRNQLLDSIRNFNRKALKKC